MNQQQPNDTVILNDRNITGASIDHDTGDNTNNLIISLKTETL